MKIKEIKIENFRLLDNVSIILEDDLTLIVGKNNTGKTSLFEIINMFFNDRNTFSFHDFSQNTYIRFQECYKKYNEIITSTDDEDKNLKEENLISIMPKIQLEIKVEYNKEKDSLINISEFISDLDDSLNYSNILLSFESKDTLRLFNAFESRIERELELIQWLNENITTYYCIKCYGGDNLIEENFKRKILAVVNFENIQASRKLDDTKADNNRTLAVGFSDYYKETNKETNRDIEELEKTLKSVSNQFDENYKPILNEILLKLKSFGVQPFLSIPEIELKSEFNAESILKNNIKYYYKNGSISLPENYNGLGYSNLIFLVLKILSFVEKFKKAKDTDKAEMLTILIEEPEAHLHPQMQQIFISQVKSLIQDVREHDNISLQLMISTHSSHIIAEAGIDVERSFERIRYFNKRNDGEKIIVEVKNFGDFKCQDEDKATYRFLKQYMNLHKCDIFFADKVIMVEGVTEKILLPLMINKVASSLNNEYISILEVGGAYTYKFRELLKYLDVKTLVVTDIDSVYPNDNRRSCSVDTTDAVTSNSTLKKWIPKKDTIIDLINCPDKNKIDDDLIRVAYQIAEDGGSSYVARSFEEAIINKNKVFFDSKYLIYGNSTEFNVKDSFTLLKDKNIDITPFYLAPEPKQKTEFTFDLMTFNEKEAGKYWEVPKYIEEGLVWLADNNISNKETKD